MSSLPQPLPPVPVQSIAYPPSVAQRPGLITAIGVISIVVASLGLMFNGVAGLQALGIVMFANFTRTAAAQQAAVEAAAAQPVAPADPMAMPLSDRQTVVRGLAMTRPITKPRREQLDALLANSGRQVFRLRGADLTVEVVRQNVTEHGQLPSATGGEGADFFIIGEGRLELADDHAKFVPGDGRESVRVSAEETGEQENWEAGLTPAQITAIVDKVEAQAGQSLTAAQKSKLQVLLNSPAQGFFDTAPTIPQVTSQVQTVSLYNDPSAAGGQQLTLTTPNGMVVLDGRGNVVSSTTWAGNAAFAGPTFEHINISAAITATVSAALSLALAVYLLVIGILMLRQHPRAARLHKIYAWVKIPLAIMGGIAWVLFWMSLFGSAATTAPMTSAVIAGCVIAVVVGCLYPVSLLLALRTKTAREYFSPVQ